MNNVYVSLAGGIGNQLFQVAAGYSYAKRYKKNLYLLSKNWSGSQGKHPDTYKKTIFRNFKFISAIPDHPTEYQEKRFNFDPIPLIKGSVHLHGYFQSLKYFEDHKDEFISELKLKPLDDEFIDSDSWCVHVRRGDYLQHSHIHLVCGTDYFLQNMKDLDKINVFTDSLPQVQGEFGNIRCNYIQSNSELSDLYLMSQHRNMILSNSSFSWWASFLGKPKETIIVPKIWFNNFQDHHDIYRPEFTVSSH